MAVADASAGVDARVDSPSLPSSSGDGTAGPHVPLLARPSSVLAYLCAVQFLLCVCVYLGHGNERSRVVVSSPLETELSLSHPIVKGRGTACVPCDTIRRSTQDAYGGA